MIRGLLAHMILNLFFAGREYMTIACYRGSCVAFALHYSIGLLHPTQISLILLQTIIYYKNENANDCFEFQLHFNFLFLYHTICFVIWILIELVLLFPFDSLQNWTFIYLPHKYVSKCWIFPQFSTIWLIT